jgi:hypothetical protein
MPFEQINRHYNGPSYTDNEGSHTDYQIYDLPTVSSWKVSELHTSCPHNS